MKNRIFALALALILILALAACGSASTKKGTDAAEMEPAQYDMAANSNSSVSSEFNGFSVTAAEKEEATTAATGTENAPSTEKIIYTGSATVETQSFDETVAAIEALAEEIGGYIQSSSINGNDFHTAKYGGGHYRSAYYELRVPADKFSAVMEGLSELGNVSSSSVYSDNVTEAYADVEARLTACRAEEQRYLELLNRADTVDEILQIESYLSDVRYEIESYTAQIKSWDSRISYSTLCLDVQEVSLYSDTTPATIGYGEQLGNALKNSAKSVWLFLKDALKFLVSALPVLLIIVVIGVPVFLLLRRSVRRRKAKAAGSSSPDREE